MFSFNPSETPTVSKMNFPASIINAFSQTMSNNMQTVLRLIDDIITLLVNQLVTLERQY